MVIITETRPVQSHKADKTVKLNKIESKDKKIAVILVRGFPDITKPIKDTLLFLNLTRKNQAVVLEDNPVTRGMLKKVKDFVAYGEINDETLQELVSKRGEEEQGRETDAKKKYHYRVFVFKGKKYKKYFRLNPPRKGFGRKGIKIAFNAGGALGYRGEGINDLVKRML
jgi:large subunit ribosomal protein L30